MPKSTPNYYRKDKTEKGWSISRDQYDQLKKRVNEGMSFATAADAWDLHPAVPELIMRGLWGPVEDYLTEQLEAEQRKKETLKSISAAISLSRIRTGDWLAERGLYTAQPRTPANVIALRTRGDAIWQILEQPRRVAEVADALGISSGAASKALRRDGRFVFIGSPSSGRWQRKSEAAAEED